MLTFALLLLLAPAQDAFNPFHDFERTIGDPAPKPSLWNPQPDPPLRDFGDRAIRFSSTPALRGGAGNVITVTPDANGVAFATAKTIRRECTGVMPDTCKLVSRTGKPFAFCVEGDCSYRGLETRVHRLMFDPDRMPKTLEERMICTDGPGYFTQLREEGQTYNLSGFCAKNHPNSAIYRLFRNASGEQWQVAWATE